MLATLSEQTAAERSSSKTAKDIKGLRRQVREQNLTTVELQNEMAKLQVRPHPLEVAALIQAPLMLAVCVCFSLTYWFVNIVPLLVLQRSGISEIANIKSGPVGNKMRLHPS